MDVQELSVNNIVSSTHLMGQVPATVFGILPPIPGKNYYHVDLAIDGLLSVPLYTIIPVSLTKEWLLEFGFRKNEPLFEEFPSMPYWANNGVCLFFNESDTRDIYLGGYASMSMGKYSAVSFRWIDSVHQLQNLYYALTNKELVRG